MKNDRQRHRQAEELVHRVRQLLHPAFSGGNSPTIQINGFHVRQHVFLHRLSFNLAPHNTRPRPVINKQRSTWSLPCASAYTKVCIGDSMAQRLPEDPDWLTIGFPGADAADLCQLFAGYKVCGINDPNRFEKALALSARQCHKCQTACWQGVKNLVIWIGHNNFLRATGDWRSIHPPQLPLKYGYTK